MSKQVYKNYCFNTFFALDEKNVKEQRARAYAALVVKVFFSEIELPLERGSEFQNVFFEVI